MDTPVYNKLTLPLHLQMCDHGTPPRYLCGGCYTALFCCVEHSIPHRLVCMMAPEEEDGPATAKDVLYRRYGIPEEYLNRDKSVYRVALRQERHIFKECATREEYDAAYGFFKEYQGTGIVPELVEDPVAAAILIVITKDTGLRTLEYYKNLGRFAFTIEVKQTIERTLVKAFGKLKTPCYRADLVNNQNNIGCSLDGTRVIFYENTGKESCFRSMPAMVQSAINAISFRTRNRVLPKTERLMTVEAIERLLKEEEGGDGPREAGPVSPKRTTP